MKNKDSYEFCLDCDKGRNYQFGQFLACECPREDGAKVIVNAVGYRYICDTIFDNLMNLRSSLNEELFEEE